MNVPFNLLTVLRNGGRITSHSAAPMATVRDRHNAKVQLLHVKVVEHFVDEGLIELDAARSGEHYSTYVAVTIH